MTTLRHKGVVWCGVVVQLICAVVAPPQLPAHLQQFLPRHPGVLRNRLLEPSSRLPEPRSIDVQLPSHLEQLLPRRDPSVPQGRSLAPRAINIHLPMARAIGTNNYYSQALNLQSSLGKRDQYNKISHKTCRGPNDEAGVCMFVWECIKSNGRHVGMCRDGYMFGSCCTFDPKINDIKPEKPEKPEKTSSNNLIPGTSSHPKLKPVPVNKNKNKKPITTSPIEATTATTTSTTTTTRPRPIVTGVGTIILSKPLNMVHKPSRPSSTTSTVSTTFSTTQVTESMKDVPTNKPDIQAVGITSWLRPRPQPITDETPAEDHVTITHPTPPSPPTRPTRPPKPTKPTRPSITAWWVTKPSKPLDSTTQLTITSHIPTTTQRNVISREPPTTPTTKTTTTRRPTTRRPTPTRRPTTRKPTTRRPTTKRPTTTSTTTTTRKTTTTMSTTPSTTEFTTIPVTDPPREGPISTNNHSKSGSVCGVPSMMPQPEGRIVNGTKAKFGEFPWQVSVRKTSFFGFSSTHRCGGALLNEQWVATAGHCVDDLLVTQIRLRFGEYDFTSIHEPAAYVERSAIMKIVHKKYNFFTYEHDLALVKMDEPIKFQPHISPICLPGNTDQLVGEDATLTGWGRLFENGPLPNVLQKATIPVIANKKCKSMFLAAGRSEYIPDIFLCAGYEHGGRDSCQGDSGGPLTVKGRDGRYFLAGIISWGIGCAEPNLPGVCTRISKFVPWILKNLQS